MSREQVLSRMYDMANKVETKEELDAIWALCSDWNREHPDEEIFMSDYQSDGSDYVNGFMIEDDWYIFEN